MIYIFYLLQLDFYGVDNVTSESDIEENDDTLIVPNLQAPLNETELPNVRNLIDPLGPSDNNGIDIYINVLDYIANK